MSVREARRLTRRLIARQPGQAGLIGLVCLIAVGTGVVTHHVALAERDRVEADAIRRYGYISVTVDDAGAPGSPVAHLPGRGFSPVPDELSSTVRVAAEQLGLRVHGRFEGAVYDAQERSSRPFIAVGPDDPVRLAADGNRLDGRRHTLAVRPPGDPGGEYSVEWIEIPSAMIAGSTPDGSLVIESSWMDTVLRVGPAVPDEASSAVNVLIAERPRIREDRAGAPQKRDLSPFVVAFELAERPAMREAAVRVVAWPQMIGYGRYAAATGADLLRPILLLIAAVATAGATSVAVRTRSRDISLLRAMGFGPGFIRRVFVCECGIASVAASTLVLVGLLAASSAGAPVELDGPIRRTLLLGAAVPPVVALLVLRTQGRAAPRPDLIEW